MKPQFSQHDQFLCWESPPHYSVLPNAKQLWITASLVAKTKLL